MPYSTFCRVVVTMAILIFAALPVQAQWVKNGAAVCVKTADQQLPQITTDGTDGAIITWEDWLSVTRGIGVARINAFGYVEWTHTIPLTIASTDSMHPQIVSDGNGGAIVTWHDPRSGNYDIYAQRIDNTGAAAWSPAAGMGICVMDSVQIDPQIVSDGVGGAIIAWEDKRGTYFNVYAQRIDADGGVHSGHWTANGIAVSQTECDQGWIELASDTLEGAIITWTDLSGEASGIGGNIYAQRVLGDGTVGPPSWPANGTAICNAINDQVYPKIIPDGAGGAIVTWSDKRENNHDDIYAQRIDADGDIHAGWTTNGEPICIHDERQRIPNLATNGAGGAIITWMDRREGDGEWDIYVNAINSSGDVTWDPAFSGVCVADAGGDDVKPIITSDGAGGAVIVWRHGAPGFYDIYAQRIDGSANPLWAAGGIAVCTATENQLYPQIIPSGTAGAIVTWQDERNYNNDIFAQRIPPPQCTVSYEFTYGGGTWQEEFLFGCPEGDGYALLVTVDFDDAGGAGYFGPHAVPPEAITLDAVSDPFTFWNNGTIVADAAADPPSYSTTITHSYIGGGATEGCGTTDIPVRLHDWVIGEVSELTVRSPDYTGDGRVNLSDLGAFGLSNNTSPGNPNYNECFDFTADEEVDLSDLGYFGAHYLDEYPFLGDAFPPDAEHGAAATMSCTVRPPHRAGRDDVLEVALSIETSGDITTMAIGIDRDPPGLTYRGWTPNPAFPGTAAALAIEHRGRPVIFIAVLGMNPPGDDAIELGTLTFTASGEGANDVLNDGLPFVFAEALGSDGKIGRVHIRGSDGPEARPPLVTRLGENYPNPFNPTTTIEYSIARDAHVSLAIYNVKGERVRTLVDAFQTRDEYRAVWDGRDLRGNEVASGVYFYRLRTAGFEESKKLVLLR